MCRVGHDVWLRVALTFSIGACSVFGDFGLTYGKSVPERALFDNATHAIVGGLTWMLVLVLSQESLARNLIGVLSCFSIASLIDLDHFVAARSWHISDATHLEKRPFLHCTTIPIVLWILFLTLSRIFLFPALEYTSWVILTAFLSHHIRDGTRRGLWFCPFGSTPPIPYYLYETLEDLTLYFYIACGIAAGALFLLFILVIVLFVKVNRLVGDGDGRIGRTPLGTSEYLAAAFWRHRYVSVFAPVMLQPSHLERSNQLNRQTNMMADFCYTNPTIVPGELLSRRGFSMYSGADSLDEEFGKSKSIQYGTYHEARSKF